MTTLIQQIEDMRVRMNELASNEQGLVKALGEALSRTDQKLLHEVHNLTVEHEARRGAILKELQLLAARMGAFPLTPREPFGAIEGAANEPPPHEKQRPALSGGDWRLAAANIQDELEFHLNARAAAG